MGASRALLFALIGGIGGAILGIGLFGPAPILIIGLYLGSAHAGISAGVAALLILINFNSISTIIFIVGTGLPALLIIRQALIQKPGADPNKPDWYPPGQILAWLTAYGLCVLSCAALYFAFSSSAMETASRNFLLKSIALLFEHAEIQFQSATDKSILKQLLDSIAHQLAPIFVGYVVSAFALKLVALTTISQGVLNRAGLSRRPSPSYVTMELPRWLSGALAAALVVAILPSTIGILGQNAVLIVSIPFLLLGLTVIHTLSRRTPNPRMVLVAIYFALFLFVALVNISVPILALLVLLGLAEQWVSLRRRFAAPSANQEDE